MLAVMFAYSGRRQSEVLSPMACQVLDLEPIGADNPELLDRTPRSGLHLARMKTTNAIVGATAFISSWAASAPEKWKAAVSREYDPALPRVTRCSQVHDAEILPNLANAILKKRLTYIGKKLVEFFRHSVRAGCIALAFKAYIPVPEIMEEAIHGSPDTLLGHRKDEEQGRGRPRRPL